MKTRRFFIVLLASITIAAGCSTKGNSVSLMHIHGLGYSHDGKQIMIPAHDGMVSYSEGKWSTTDGKKHDYMGFNIVDNGFYSSGHPAVNSGLSNPLGIVKSTDNGKTLQMLDLAGVEDFHGMAVGYKSHAIYVYNSKPNARLTSVGLNYTLDETKTWKKSEMKGLNDEPLTMAAHPTDAAIIAVGTKNGLFLSKDYGNHFDTAPMKSLFTALAFGINGDLWIGTPNSLVRLTGDVVNQIKIPSLDQDDSLAYIAQNPVNDKEIAFATFKKNVYISSDKGVVWAKIVTEGKGVNK